MSTVRGRELQKVCTLGGRDHSTTLESDCHKHYVAVKKNEEASYCHGIISNT